MSQVFIRPYRDSDLDDLYRICLQTGDGGADATSMFDDPRILGHVFAAPYGLFEPSLAFVAEDEAGVGGYIVGALDSRAFEERLEADWWPALRDRYPAPPPELPPDQWTPDQRAARFIHVPLTVPYELAEDYPSHLHINLVPRLQSQGLGRQLMNTLIPALREQGSVGLHFFVWPANQRAVGFYRHLGFTMISAERAVIFAMDLRPPPEGVHPGRPVPSGAAVPAQRPSSTHCSGADRPGPRPSRRGQPAAGHGTATDEATSAAGGP